MKVYGNKRTIAKCIAAFDGVFTNVFAALLPHIDVATAFDHALDLAQRMEERGDCNPVMKINYDTVLDELSEDQSVVNYTSRSGNNYAFGFSKTDWYNCWIEYPVESSLSTVFLKISEEGLVEKPA